ncbi:hypothetical protein F5Y19DRAFT_112372 [Xylariaceae sp. FL1651]|nr:hypothetical protein F5Y19DRAFT_112372 [Xylariaceae sp. FL1651]
MLKDDFVQICRKIWPNLAKHEYVHRTYASVLDYFETQTKSLINRTNDFGLPDTISIIERLASDQDILSSRSSCVNIIKVHLPQVTSEAAILSCGDRALRMMLTLDIRIGSRGASILRAGSPIIDWGESESLTETIENHFINNSTCITGMVTGRVDPSLSLAYLCTYRGFKVFWTSNLSEHLSISWKSKIITVYEHKVFLWNHLRNSNTPIIPRVILEEAIDTLNLLFPLNDRLTKTFLAQHGKDFQGLGYCSRPRDLCLDLAKFSIWRDRIAELVGIMNEEPKGLKQLALERDGRNLLPFVTFWVAIAVAVLSLLNLPFAILSMKYTIKQYELALAQTCSDPSAKDTLPQYCSPG